MRYTSFNMKIRAVMPTKVSPLLNSEVNYKINLYYFHQHFHQDRNQYFLGFHTISPCMLHRHESKLGHALGHPHGIGKQQSLKMLENEKVPIISQDIRL